MVLTGLPPLRDPHSLKEKRGYGWAEVSLYLLLSLPYREQPDIYKPMVLARATRKDRQKNKWLYLLSSRSWRIADVADAFAPTTGMYLMNDYLIFKEQSAVFFGCI